MMSQWQKKFKNKFDQNVALGSLESNNFVELLKRFHAEHQLILPNDFSDSNLLQEGGWFYLRTKAGQDILVQNCSYGVKNVDINYIWVKFNNKIPSVIIEINYKNGKSEKFDILKKEEIAEFYP